MFFVFLFFIYIYTKEKRRKQGNPNNRPSKGNLGLTELSNWNPTTERSNVLNRGVNKLRVSAP